MPRILIIDDDDGLRSLLAGVLKSAGYAVVEATTGAAAIPLLRTEPPDLVVTDIVMPDQDGLGVIMMIRKEIPEVPVVAMSGALARTGLYLSVAQKLGARRVLQKPFTSDVLLAAVREALPGAAGS